MHVKRAYGILRLIRPEIAVILLCAAGLGAVPATTAAAATTDLTLAAPPDLQATGILRFLLPRFRFKKRVSIGVVLPDAAKPDIVLAPKGPGTVVLVARQGGTKWYLRLPAKGAPGLTKARAFAQWLDSKPGRAAISAFPVGGPALFDPAPVKVEVAVVEKLLGNARRGHQVARKYCMRCHVVDRQNPFAGIGSTPSFAVVRTFADWQTRLSMIWSTNPHRALITVTGLSDKKDPLHPATIAPIIISQKDMEDLLAYVASVPAADLGQPVLRQ